MPTMKDHYYALGVSPSATHDEIRKAFRRLAFQYHPDRNPAQFARQRFEEIHEAWRVLKDRATRIAYDKSYYANTPAASQRRLPASAEDVLALSTAFRLHAQGIDPFRFDTELLAKAAEEILSPSNLELLEGNPPIGATVLKDVLAGLEPLPFPRLAGLLPALDQLAGNVAHGSGLVAGLVRRSRYGYLWERYKTVVALTIAALACLAIYLSGK
jgi:hypothetical protein